MSSVRSTYGLSNNQLKGLKHSNKKNTTSGNLGAYLGKDPYSGDLRAARDKEFRDIKRDIQSPPALGAISDAMSDEIVSVGKRVITKSYEVV